GSGSGDSTSQAGAMDSGGAAAAGSSHAASAGSASAPAASSPSASAASTANAALPMAAPGTRAWCRALDAKWYASGKPFRDLPRLAGRPSPIFRRWLEHPAYDEYWRRFAPSASELAHIDIPVLSMTGYYTPGQAGT